MKTASVQQIKEALKHLSQAETTELCLRLTKYKKENKELLAYCLFDEHDTDGYIANVKAEMDALFTDVNTTNLYFAKKTLRKILRIANKHIKYMGNKEAEITLLIHFCNTLQASKIPVKKSTALKNLLEGQIKKIHKLLPLLHEDLQHDYQKQLTVI